MTRVLYWALASSPQWFCWQLNSIFLLLCPHLSSHEKRKMLRTGTDNSLLLNFRIINQTLISEEIFLRDQQAPSLSYLVKKVGAEGVIHTPAPCYALAAGEAWPRRSILLPPQNGAWSFSISQHLKQKNVKDRDREQLIQIILNYLSSSHC